MYVNLKQVNLLRVKKMSKDNFKLMIKSSLIIKIIAVMLSFINTIIINRFLGVELRGEYTFILNSANLVHLILN